MRRALIGLCCVLSLLPFRSSSAATLTTSVSGLVDHVVVGMLPGYRGDRLEGYVAVLAYSGLVAVDQHTASVDPSLSMVVCSTRFRCWPRTISVVVSSNPDGSGTLVGKDPSRGRLVLRWKPKGLFGVATEGFCSMRSPEGSGFDTTYRLVGAGQSATSGVASASVSGSLGVWRLPRSACSIVGADAIAQVWMAIVQTP